MKIKLIRNTIVNGAPAAIDAVLDVAEDVGKYLVAIGKAVESAAETVREAAGVPDDDPEPAPAPKKKLGRPRKTKAED